MRPTGGTVGGRLGGQMASRFTADIILSYARDHGVDLIVIGAYSHARSVEMVFGGRMLLKQAPVPVLMSR
jgi:nucleotide-binding universal stress UspA family protein